MKWKSREVKKNRAHQWFAWKPVRCLDVDTPVPAETWESQRPDTMVWFGMVYREREDISYDWVYYTVAEWVRRQLVQTPAPPETP